MSQTQLTDAYRTCTHIVRENARNFYYAFWLLSKERRRAIHAVYAFCRLCDDAADDPAPTEQRHEKLQAYRAQLDGESTAPVFMALADARRRFGIPTQYFEELIDGVSQDLTVTRYPDFASLRRYCYLVASTVGLICIHIFGFDDEAAKERAIDLGLALQLTNILRDLREDAVRGRIYLPQDELNAHGVPEKSLQTGNVDDAFRSLMAYQIERARAYYRSGGRLMAHLPAHARACPTLLHDVYARILDHIEAADYDVFSRRHGPTRQEKLLMLGRVWTRSLLTGR